MTDVFTKQISSKRHLNMFTDYLSKYKWVIYVVIIATIVTGLFYYRHKIIVGERDRVNKIWEAREIEIQRNNLSRLMERNNEVANKQSQLESAHRQIIEKDRELDNVRNMYADLRNKYASGSLRMSVPTTKSGDSGAKQNKNSTTSERDVENRELVPEVSTEILDFARDYQRNLRLKNQCIDLYNAAMEKVNELE